MAYPTETAHILEFMGYAPFADFEVSIDAGIVTLNWFHVDPKPTDTEVLAQARPWAAYETENQIYREAGIRMASCPTKNTVLFGQEMNIAELLGMDEMLNDVLLPASVKTLNENQTPFHYNAFRHLEEMNALRDSLAIVVANQSNTYLDILAFDITVGWTLPRP